MSTAKHTPGPWNVLKESPHIVKQGYAHIGPEDTSGVLVGSAAGYPGSGFFPSDEEAIANARLIAAAPDLLAACLEVRRRLFKLESVDGIEECQDILLEAIAKAEAR